MSYLDVNDLPEEITEAIYPLMSEYGTVLFHDSTMDGYTTLGDPVEVTFKLKKKDEISKQLVVDLRDKASKIRAEAEIECSQIEEKIQSLLALPSGEQ